MVSQSIKLFHGGLSFLAAFLFTNGIFELACNRQIDDDAYLDSLWELTKQDLNLDYQRGKLRDEFSYTLTPWKVSNDIHNGVNCSNTTETGLIKMVVFIKSATSYEHRRNIVRQTWGRISHIENVVIHVVFIVGSTDKEVQKAIDAEHSQHGDILQFIGVDDYRHIAYKVLAGMQWARDNLPPEYFYATADDDLSVNIHLLPRELRRHMRNAQKRLQPPEVHNHLEQVKKMPILCILRYFPRAAPGRSLTIPGQAKYYMDPQEYHLSFLPPFCLGGWYMMPAVTAGKIYDTSRKEKVLPMDDVYITGILRIRTKAVITIEPMDKTCTAEYARRGYSRFVEHFRGDTDFSTPEDVHRLVISNWKMIENDIRSTKHCFR